MKKKILPSQIRSKTNIVGVILIVLWCIFSVVAIGWIILASFSTTSEIYSGDLLSSGLHFENYMKVIEKNNLLRYFVNSAVYTVIACLGIIVVASPASYVVSKYDFPGKKLLQVAYQTAMGIPAVMLMVPLYMIAVRLHLTGKPVVLVIIYICVQIPFSFFYLISFFATIPKEIQEAALVDGCNHNSAFWRVILPLAKPGISSVTIFNVVGLWNEYTWALVFANNSQNRTVSLGLQAILDGMRYSGDWAALFAAVVMVVFPTFIMFLFLSDKIYGRRYSGGSKRLTPKKPILV